MPPIGSPGRWIDAVAHALTELVYGAARGERVLRGRQREVDDAPDKPGPRRSDSARARDRAEMNQGGPSDHDPTINVTRAILQLAEAVRNRSR